jgi:hypothetical protein
MTLFQFPFPGSIISVDNAKEILYRLKSLSLLDNGDVNNVQSVLDCFYPDYYRGNSSCMWCKGDRRGHDENRDGGNDNGLYSSSVRNGIRNVLAPGLSFLSGLMTYPGNICNDYNYGNYE